MDLLRRSLLSIVATSALAIAPLGCAPPAPTDFSLKVVVRPSSQEASASCTELGSSDGVSQGNLVAARWFQTAARTSSADGTWYVVTITGFEGNVHSWTYTEAQARAGITVDAHYDDNGGPVDVQIRGAFAVIDPCTP
jgi:hypothetical protein